MNVEQPGWRAVSPGTPTQYYTRPDGGSIYLGLHPAPSISGTDTWAVILPYVAVPPDMSADADQPFTISSNPIKALRFFHRALVHYAAYDLEKLRKEVGRSAGQLQLFELEIQKYISAQKPKQGAVVRLAMDYRAVGRRAQPVRFDPRT